MFDPFAEYDLLLQGFIQVQREAQQQREGATDDQLVKMSYIGFCRHEQSERWGQEQVKFIQAHRSGEYSNENLTWFEEDTLHIALFSFLALGALLGLYSRGQISDTEFSHGQMLLPGYLRLNDDQITQTEGESE